MSYKPFERVTASRLHRDDVVLVRRGKQDHWTGLAPGYYTVQKVTAFRFGIQQKIKDVVTVFAPPDGPLIDSKPVAPSVKWNRVTG